MFSDHIVYSHDFSDLDGVDTTKRNLTLITTGTDTVLPLFTIIAIFFVASPIVVNMPANWLLKQSLILTLNCFSFSDNYYKQNGT